MSNKIAFLGGTGNMSGAIIRGLIKQGQAPENIMATGRTPDKLSALAAELDIRVSSDNIAACQWADVIVLSVKPQMMRELCLNIAPTLALRHQAPLIISVAAGIATESYQKWLGSLPTVRSMPNTPSQIGLGATGLFANAKVSDEQKKLTETVFDAVGICQWVDSENLIDTVTAISGSGPAYYFLFIESMIDAAIAQGMSPETAKQLTLQTALGAATLAGQSEDEPGQLRRKVTSPGGTTFEAIKVFTESNLQGIVSHAMQACADRGGSLADELGQD